MVVKLNRRVCTMYILQIYEFMRHVYHDYHAHTNILLIHDGMDMYVHHHDCFLAHSALTIGARLCGSSAKAQAERRAAFTSMADSASGSQARSKAARATRVGKHNKPG